jgi:hypothetical protein
MISVNKLPYLAFLLLSLASCEDDDPKASFIAEQNPDNKPLYATFTSTSQNAESVRWIIEGNTVTAPLLEYRFSGPGTYSVDLEITNEDGETDRVSHWIEIPAVDACGAARKAVEQALLDQYCAEHNITPLREESTGLKYIVTQTGNGKKVETGFEIVEFQVTYYLLDGTLAYKGPVRRDEFGRFDLDAQLAIRSLDEGGKALWFSPSCWAFSYAGYSDKIPPYAPVIEEFELIEVGPEPCHC